MNSEHPSHHVLVLASQSPRRRTLLAEAGFEFIVDVAAVDERVHFAEMAEAYVKRIALLKATEVGEKYPDAFVLAADTTVVLPQNNSRHAGPESISLDGARVLGKPQDDEEARKMLSELSGRSHLVLTAITLLCESKQFVSERLIKTLVTFRKLDADDIERYIRSGEPFDKAGGYGIQGLAASFVAAIDGSYTNVVGLPLAEVVEALKAVSIVPSLREKQ